MQPRERLSQWSGAGWFSFGEVPRVVLSFSLALVLLAVVAVALSGCSAIFPNTVGQMIGARYQHSHAKHVRVDFTKYVGGDWTQLTIVCGPVRGSAINRALGFHWAKSSSLQPADGSAILFSTNSTMINSFTVGVNDVNSNQYFVPCFPPGMPNPSFSGQREVRQVIVVPRAHATLTLTADHDGLGWPVWYFNASEREALLRLYGSSREHR